MGSGDENVAGPDFLSMRRAFVSYSRPIRFDEKSVNRGLPVLDLPQARRIVGSGDENGKSPETIKDGTIIMKPPPPILGEELGK